MKPIYDLNNYYDQTNNPLEEYNKKQMVELSRRFGFAPRPATYLETCGPSAAATCLALSGHRSRIESACKIGNYLCQPEQIIFDFMNDMKRNGKAFKAITALDLSTIPGNRIAALYPFTVKELFGARAEYFDRRLALPELEKIINDGGAVQVSQEPGHFIAIGDFAANEIIYNDPWNGHDGISGSCRRMSFTFYEAQIRNYAVVYYRD